jgi:hypothetical protein
MFVVMDGNKNGVSMLQTEVAKCGINNCKE